MQKRASMSIELGLGIALAAVVLLVALGLFSTNLSSLFSSGGYNNIFGGNRTKVADAKGNGFDKVSVNETQLNVAIVGEQGNEIDRLKDETEKMLEKLGTKEELTNSEINDLAKYLTVNALLVGNTGVGYQDYLTSHTNIWDLVKKYDIHISSTGFTRIGNNVIQWDNETSCITISHCTDNAAGLKEVINMF